MSHDRLIVAIGRIERALSKIEQAPMAAPSVNPRDRDLAERHARLKAETAAILDDIDRLIAEGGR